MLMTINRTVIAQTSLGYELRPKRDYNNFYLLLLFTNLSSQNTFDWQQYIVGVFTLVLHNVSNSNPPLSSCVPHGNLLNVKDTHLM